MYFLKCQPHHLTTFRNVFLFTGTFLDIANRLKIIENNLAVGMEFYTYLYLQNNHHSKDRIEPIEFVNRKIAAINLPVFHCEV